MLMYPFFGILIVYIDVYIDINIFVLFLANTHKTVVSTANIGWPAHL